MSYTVATPGGPKARPGTVTLASIMLYAAAALILITGGLSLYQFLTIDVSGLIETPGTDAQTAETAASFVQVFGYIMAALYAVLAIGFAVLAGLVGKGKNPARIVTWVLGGIGVICCGCSALSGAFEGQLNSMQGVDAATQAELAASIPGWMNAANLIIGILIVLTLLAAIVLLMLPASNDFFRKEQEVWVPPTYPTGGFPPPPAGPGTLPPPPGGPGTLPPPPGGGTTPLQ